MLGFVESRNTDTTDDSRLNSDLRAVSSPNSFGRFPDNALIPKDLQFQLLNMSELDFQEVEKIESNLFSLFIQKLHLSEVPNGRRYGTCPVILAPEYAMTGHFSTKSDVYSFGVIILEIVSGQKNRFYTRPQLEEALLLRALKLWSEERALELVDSSLDNRYSSEEVRKCIQIGLLCIQEDPIKRPNMSSIVVSFSGQYITFPSPIPPNFFTSSPDSDGTPYGPRSMLHNGLTSFSGTENITEVVPR